MQITIIWTICSALGFLFAGQGAYEAGQVVRALRYSPDYDAHSLRTVLALGNRRRASARALVLLLFVLIGLGSLYAPRVVVTGVLLAGCLIAADLALTLDAVLDRVERSRVENIAARARLAETTEQGTTEQAVAQ